MTDTLDHQATRLPAEAPSTPEREPLPGGPVEPRYKAPDPIDPRTTIGHVHMKAANLDLIRSFYVDVLGFSITAEMPGAIFLSAGGYHHDLAFNVWQSHDGPTPHPQMTGLYHIALRYPTRETLSDAFHRLLAAGWPIEGASDHGTHEALYLRDPEGNGLELCWDRPTDEWPLNEQGHVMMEGKRLDLDNLLAAQSDAQSDSA